MPNTTPSAAQRGDFSAALDALEAELSRIEVRELLPVNVDVSAAAMIAMGVVPKLAAHRAAMVEWFGAEMAANVDRVEQAAFAAWAAHGRYGSAAAGAEIPVLAALVNEERSVLLADAQQLVARKAISPDMLAQLSGVHGFKNLCFDVLKLVSALQQNWDAASRHTRLERSDLARAEAAASRLACAVSLRDQAGSSPEALLRQRAFTHFVRTYNQIRRMLAFLRFDEGDADLIAPSLWSGRSSRRKRAAASEPGLLPSTPLSPGSEIAPGLPGASPFLEG